MLQFIIKDHNNNQIYSEYSDGYWTKRKFDQNNNIIYFESSYGITYKN